MPTSPPAPAQRAAPAVATPAPPSGAVPTPATTGSPPAAVRADPLPLRDADDWLALVAACGLKGPAFQLASHCAFLGRDGDALRVHLAAEDAHLRSESLVRQATQALSQALGAAIQLRFEAAAASGAPETLQGRQARERSERQRAAEQDFRADPVVSQLLGQGGAIVPDSIRPLSENGT